VLPALAVIATLMSADPATAGHSLGVHWARSGTALAQVYFVDHTGTRWPVNASTLTWNNSTRVKSYYRTASQGCPSSPPRCLHVWEINANTGYVGTTSYTVDANGHFSWAEIKLNNFHATTSSDRRQTVCREQGRALGLHHQYTNDSCMNDNTYAQQYRNGHDYDQLAPIYNHSSFGSGRGRRCEHVESLIRSNAGICCGGHARVRRPHR
jgi:hypothetical protein